jgi:alpha-beta hydrolase superfamily lysophospholipase
VVLLLLLLLLAQAMIKTELEWSDGGRPVYLMGESFGGILCLALAHKLGDYIDRVVSHAHK